MYIFTRETMERPVLDILIIEIDFKVDVNQAFLTREMLWNYWKIVNHEIWRNSGES